MCQALYLRTSPFPSSEFCRKPYTIRQGTVGARHFEVRLWGASGEIHLTVRDSGLGFNPDAAMKGRGLGLVSMRERMKLVKGEFSIDSQPKGGTTIHARVLLGQEVAPSSRYENLVSSCLHLSTACRNSSIDSHQCNLETALASAWRRKSNIDANQSTSVLRLTTRVHICSRRVLTPTLTHGQLV
jgi:hypothetical protein